VNTFELNVTSETLKHETKHRWQGDYDEVESVTMAIACTHCNLIGHAV